MSKAHRLAWAAGFIDGDGFITIQNRTSKVNGKTYLKIKPNGYEYPIELPVITKGSREEANAWTWNGDREKPTLRPSIKTTQANGDVTHIWLNDGECRYLNDSTDGFAGQKLPLQEL